MPVPITLAVEGQLDSMVAARLLRHCGLAPGDVHGLGGKGLIDKRLAAYNSAARRSPWLVLRDLDHDAPCAPDLVDRLLPDKAPRMLLRVPVRSIESWILADSVGFAGRFGVSHGKVPRSPDENPSPKAAMISLFRASRLRWVREDMCPGPTSKARVGIRYTTELADFVSTNWSPSGAARRSPSLEKCLQALGRLAE